MSAQRPLIPTMSLPATDDDAAVVPVSFGITASEALQQIIATAPCLFWYAIVVEENENRLSWQMHIPDEKAAQRFLPLDCSNGLTYGEAWYWSRFPEDRDKANVHGRQSTQQNRDYQQEFRCRNRF